jgi:hypothetical protein
MAPDFERLARTPCPDRLLGILRHEPLQLGLGPLMLQIGQAGLREDAGQLGSGIRRAHVDNADRLDLGLGRIDPEELRHLAVFHTAPELSLRRDHQMLLERVRMRHDLDPLALQDLDSQRQAAVVKTI